MAKTKQKNHSELEYLRGIIRKLKNRIKYLQKKLNELDHREKYYEEILEDVLETHEADVNYEACKNCGKGIIEKIDLKYLIIHKCNICKFQEKFKPSGEKRD